MTNLGDELTTLDDKDKDNYRIMSKMEICYELLYNIVAAVTAVTLIFIFVARTVIVRGSSMEPNLHDSERLILNSMLYTPKKGDIVVLSNPNWTMLDETTIIKRIIATEGDEIDINFDTGEVMVNGLVIDEPYIKEVIKTKPSQPIDLPIIVPDGHVFVMGDNRNNSADSRNREIGIVDNRYLIGKLIVRMKPFQVKKF